MIAVCSGTDAHNEKAQKLEKGACEGGKAWDTTTGFERSNRLYIQSIRNCLFSN